MNALFAAPIVLLTLLQGVANASNSDLTKDIKSIRGAQLAKGELETTAEFKERRAALYQRYTNKTYRLEFSVKSLETESYKPLTYNPDNEQLTFSLPSLGTKLMWVASNGDKKIGWLAFSFLPTEPRSIKSDSYIGRNGLGTQVKVDRHYITTIGVAVLGRSNKDMTPQKFSVQVPRSQVKDLLERGRVTLDIKSDLQDLEEKPSLLLTEEDETEPKMQRPIHVVRTSFMLPVRLIALSLADSKGARILHEQGAEQDTNALEIK
jgi:hypothetical protein